MEELAANDVIANDAAAVGPVVVGGLSDGTNLPNQEVHFVPAIAGTPADGDGPLLETERFTTAVAFAPASANDDTLTINGVDYVTAKNLVSLETSWKNNLRMNDGFYPGSGFQTGGDASTGAIRGRLEFGNRQGTLKFVAKFDSSSAEYAKLKAQTTGTAVMALAFDSNNSLQLTWQKIAFSVVEITETDQFATVAVDCVPQYDATNGILTAVAKVAADGVCQ